MDLTFSVLGSLFSETSSEVTYSWGEWARLLTSKEEVDVRAGKDGPGVVLARLSPSKRTRANVREVYAVGLDLDPPKTAADPAAWAAALGSALEALAPYEHVVWTTFSSTSDLPRLRVILPLAEPTDADGYDAAHAQLSALLPGIVDQNAKDASRYHYLPAVPSQKALSEWSASHNRGSFFRAPSASERPAPTSRSAPTTLQPAEARLRAEELKDWLVGRTRALQRIQSVAKAVAAGEAFGEPGERHGAMLHLTMVIASKYRPHGGSEPEHPDVVVEAFRESLAVMAAKQVEAPSADEVRRAYEGAVEKHQSSTSLMPATTYTADELFKIAERQDVSPTDLKNRWVVGHRDGYFYLDETGNYRGPFLGETKDVAMKQVLQKAPVPLYAITREGRRLKRAKEVLEENGQVVEDCVDDMSAQVSVLEPHLNRIRVASCPRRPLAPTYDPDIDHWLRLLGGSCYPKLVDWLSVLPDPSKLLCALYFDGAPGTGKTLFAQGIAAIWSDAVTRFEDFQDSFNDLLKKCPVVFADEEVSVNHFKRSSATTLIREMITTSQRIVNEKHRPKTALFGAIRLILAANGDTLLTWKDAASAHDLEAIGQRILYINPSAEAADFLVKMGKERCDFWLRQGLAQHVLWLFENHTVKEPGGRFIVEGDISRLHRTMLTGAKVTSEVIEVLVRFLLKPNRLRATKAPIARSRGELLVNVDGLRVGWSLLDRQHENPPSTTLLGRALRTIARDDGYNDRRMEWDGRRVRVVSVDLEHLVAWAEHQSVASREELVEAMEADDLNETPWAEGNDMEDPV